MVLMRMLVKMIYYFILVMLLLVDDQNNKLMTESLGWFPFLLYGQLIKELEDILFPNGFSVDKIVPGRLYNVYFQMQSCKDN